MKCLKYGQKCAGYRADRLHEYSTPTVPRRKAILLPAVKATPDLKSDSEQRSFHFYRHITGPTLSSDYDSGFWITTVLRFSHTIPAVRHAVLAVGSLHENLIYENTNLNAELAKKQIFAFQQYNKAISLLREQLNSQNDQEALTPLLLCVLFVCLEFIQRKNIEALTHLQQGRQLLHIIMQSKHLSSAQSDLIRQHIAPIYMRSGLTLYLFGIGTPPVPDSLNLYLENPDIFQSVHQARHAFYSILDDSLRWRFLWKTNQRRDPRVPTDFAYKTTHHNSEPLTPDKIRDFKAKQENLLSRLGKWNTAFSLLRASNACKSTPTASLLLLQILYHTAIVWTSTAMSEAEQVFDEHIEHFSAIIPLCAAYLETRKEDPETFGEDLPKDHGHFKQTDLRRKMTANCDKENHEKVVFSFETGIVPVLFLTAAKCRHPHIRRAAVGLLSRHEERQENLWKAKVFARIAAHMIHIETETGKKFRQEQGQLSSLAVPRCSTPQEDLYCAPSKPAKGCRPFLDRGVRVRASHPVMPTKFPVTGAIICPSSASTGVHGVQHTRYDFHSLAHSLPPKDSNTPTLLQDSLFYRDLGSTEPLNRPSTPDVGNFSLSPESSTNGYSIASTPDSCLSTQSDKDSVLTSIDDNCDGNFGIPEHLRISDAIIGPHEETGINVTLFRKPGRFCKEWEIRHDLIQVD
jgi:hypothetical protein